MNADCKRFTELLTLEAPSTSDTAFLSTHAERCPSCASFRSALGALGTAEATDELASRRLVADVQAAFARERRAGLRRSLGWGVVALAAAGIAWGAFVPHAPPADTSRSASAQPALSTQTKTLLQQAMYEHRERFGPCADLFGSADAGTTTRVVVDFTVSTTGAVSRVKVVSNPGELTTWERCVADTVATLTLPPVQEDVEISYPFLFAVQDPPAEEGP